jgi:hypothetical protein
LQALLKIRRSNGRETTKPKGDKYKIKDPAEQRADNHLAGGKSFAGYGKDYMKMPEYGKSIVKYR